MTIYQAYPIISLAATVGYVLILLLSLIRKGQNAEQNRWLLLILAISIGWEFSLFFAASAGYAQLPTAVLLLSTAALTVLTSHYLEWRIPRLGLFLGGVAILASWVVTLLFPYRYILLPNNTPLPLSNSQLLTYATWFTLALLLLRKTWRDYKATGFPWHANRLLYWFVVLATIYLGELLQFFDLFALVIAGQIVRLLGIFGLRYGVTTFRIFDVRTRGLRSIAFLIVNTLSALPLIMIIIFILQFGNELTNNEFVTAVLITVVVTLGFFFYEPYRSVIERITYRYLRGEDLNTNQIVRNYSQAISRTLDVQQLSVLVVGTLSELLETNRGALLLLNRKTDDTEYELEPIPAMGMIPRELRPFNSNSLFIQTLMHENQPLLQYDLDFNPNYNQQLAEERAWLKEMAMEVYVPVGAAAEMEGLIAIGPKSSGVPYQESELELMQILADQTVVALQNARLYSELNGQNEHIRHLNTDLTEQNERLEIMDKVKSDFITIASHELRTPLTQVKGYSDILAAMNEENALTREQTKEIVGHINRATLQLETLITAMLDASQLDVDGMQLTFVKTRMDTIMRLSMEPMVQATRERRIAVSFDGVAELPPIYADFKRLVQAFTNLLGNAVKYTPDNGRIHIQAILLPSTTNDEFLEITINDTGIGIDPKYHDLIFEKFFRIGDPQLHSTGNTKFKGAGPGLGLPIAKGVIEAHGGRIWVESEGEDEQRLPGSKFHIILPINPPGAESKTAVETNGRPSYLIG